MGPLNDLFEEILRDGPSMRTQRYILEKMQDDGNAREVVRACIRALEHDPDDIRMRRLLAHCYRDLGFLSLEENELSLAAEKIEQLIPLYKDQAHLLASQERVDEASSALRKYVAHYPEDEDALALLEDLEKAKVEVQTEALPESHEADPPAAEPEEIFPEMATHTLAEIYVTQGQNQAAMETYKRLLAQDPEDQKARKRLQKLEAEMDHEGLIPEPASLEKIGKKKMINVLKGWLARIQETSRTAQQITAQPGK